MKILSIETSCDETAISIVEAEGGIEKPRFTVLGNSLFSQMELHREYGGVFPNLAKREHAKNLPPLLLKSLAEAGLNTSRVSSKKSEEVWQKHYSFAHQSVPWESTLHPEVSYPSHRLIGTYCALNLIYLIFDLNLKCAEL